MSDINIRRYLSPKIQDEIMCLGDNISEIWAELNRKYGDEGKLIDIILADLKKCCRVTDRPSDILILINVVERAFIELKYLGREGEMNNNMMISIIKDKLPPSIDTLRKGHDAPIIRVEKLGVKIKVGYI